MDKYDLTQKVPSINVITMAIVVMLFIVLAVYLYIWIKRAYPEKHKGAVMGLLSYFCICNGVMYLIAYVESFIKTSISQSEIEASQLTVIQNCVEIVFVLIECAVLVLLLYYAFDKMFFVQGNNKYGNVLAFTFGLVIIEIVNSAVRVAAYWVIASKINSEGLASILEGVSEEEIDGYMKSVQVLFDYTPLDYIYILLNTVMFFVFALSIITMIWLIAKGYKKLGTLRNAWIMYALYYLPGLLKAFGLLTITAVYQIILYLYVIVAALYAREQFKASAPEDYAELKDILSQGIFKVILIKNRSTVKKNMSKGSISHNANIDTKK